MNWPWQLSLGSWCIALLCGYSVGHMFGSLASSTLFYDQYYARQEVDSAKRKHLFDNIARQVKYATVVAWLSGSIVTCFCILVACCW